MVWKTGAVLMGAIALAQGISAPAWNAFLRMMQQRTAYGVGG